MSESLPFIRHKYTMNSQWADEYPQDQGKTFGEIARRFYE